MKDTIPTRYEYLDLVRLHQLFSTEKWDHLTPDEKTEACQEVVNRYAVENNTWACKVSLSEMEGSSYGYESRGCIVLNEHLVKDGQFISKDIDADGNIVYTPIKVDAANWNVLDTVYHEGTHGIQEAKGTLHRTYFNGSTDYSLYRIQSNEKEAYANGQFRTLQAIDSVQKLTGEKDAEAERYYQTVKAESFKPYLDRAVRDYNDSDIEKTLNQFIDDRDNGLVNSNPGESYLAVERAYNDQYYSVNKTSGLTNDCDIGHVGMNDTGFDQIRDDGARLGQTMTFDQSENDGAALDYTAPEDNSVEHTGGLSQNNGMEM